MKRPEERKIRWIDPRLPEAEYNRIAFDFLKARVKVLEPTTLPTGCWEWQGHVHPEPNPYGSTSYRGKGWRVHRLAYHLAKGPIPAGLDICHECDYKRCCNPDHLFPGTHRDNMLDMRAKKKMHQDRITHCPKDHEYTPENTRYVRTKIGGLARACRACDRLKAKDPSYVAWRREYQRRKRAEQRISKHPS